MLKNIRIILATTALILAIFSLFGIDEMKKKDKAKAFVYFLGSASVLYVGVSSMLS